MPADRYYIDAPLIPEERVSVEGQEMLHLVRVMRHQVGDSIELVNGRGILAAGTIEELTKRSAEIKVDALLRKKRPTAEVIIAQAIPRLNRLETIIEKGTELGMTQLWLFPGTHSEKKNLTPNQMERLQHIAIAAMKQCGRLDLPVIAMKPPLKQWEQPLYPAFFGDLSPEAPPFLKALQAPQDGVLFFIGPEQGFSDKELTQLKKLGAQGVTLHRNILRSDTAPLAALTLIASA